MSWYVGMVCNAGIGIAYLFISAGILVPLARSNQLRTNHLGAGTAAIFFTCAIHHGSHAVHMLLPSFGLDDERGLAMRTAWDWPLSIWDAVGLAVAIYYWSQRRTYGPLMRGAALFEDMRKRERQALELNDTVLQGLVVAKLALDLGDTARAQAALSTSIGSASTIITELLGSDPTSVQLLRSIPAVVERSDPPTAPAEERPR